MEFQLDIYHIGHEAQLVTGEHLPDVYKRLQGRDSATITWNDGGDRVLIVSVGEDDSTVSLLNDATWYYLEISPETELVGIMICGQQAWVPKDIILPKNLGLEV